LNDGRWHFQHGPIDLIIGCDGDPGACDAALADAWERFQPVLDDLVPQLPALRRAVAGDVAVRGAVAAAMVAACRPYGEGLGLFVTPMAAVAGSVADHIATAFDRRGIDRACVNNGGDIALRLSAGHHYDVGLVTDLEWPAVAGRFRIDASSPVRGIATSGWRGRSFSLGIADSVTVLACTGAMADAAATLVANAVDIDSPAVCRRPACTLRDDTDLGDRLVTVAVGALSDLQVATALGSGAAFAASLCRQGLIEAAALTLAGQARVVRSR
jgi:ApbE superfamily uncharacterized protein (UPF0280 family)